MLLKIVRYCIKYYKPVVLYQYLNIIENLLLLTIMIDYQLIGNSKGFYIFVSLYTLS